MRARASKDAAKHLFAHLHDAPALLRNPIVSRLLSTPSEPSELDERGLLDRVHHLVRQAGEHVRSCDLHAGERERAARQHAIVTLHFLQGRPIGKVATLLGISARQCYRERSDIRQRIARYLAEYDENAPLLNFLAETDEFTILMEQTVRRTTLLDMEASLRECDQLVAAASSVQQRIEALRATAFCAISFGNVERANAAHTTAKQFLAGLNGDGGSARQAASACVSMMGFELAYYRGDTAESVRLARDATLALDAIASSAPARLQGLYVDSLYGLGIALCISGNAAAGYEQLVRADANRRDIYVAAQSKARIAVEIWKLRTYLAAGSRTWYPAAQRRNGFAAAFRAAYAAGSLSEATAALVALAEHHAICGSDAEVLHAARLALLLAKQQNSERIRSETEIEVAAFLARTACWDQVRTLYDPQKSKACDDYRRGLKRYIDAQLALRTSAFERAWSLATSPPEAQPPSLAVRNRLVAARAAGALGRKRDAWTAIDSAIAAAEALGSAPILKEAYCAARDVTGDAAFGRKADAFTHLLTA